MNPEQALKNLDTIASQTKLNREEHVVIQQSVQVLRTSLAALAVFENPDDGNDDKTSEENQ